MINKSIDFLKEVEGYRTEYYIPKDSNGNILGHSGITIGLGIDLGQQSKHGMLKLDVNKVIVSKVKLALGVRGKEACSVLYKLPKLTSDEVYSLSVAIVERGLEVLRERLNTIYKTLPDEVIVIALSLHHQFGYKLFSYNAWKQIKNKDYKGLLKNLRNFGCNYPTRRNIEANYLERALNKQGLL